MFPMLDCIEEWCLSIVVYDVRIGAVLDQRLNHQLMALPCRVEYGCLPVRIHMVSCAAITHQQLHQVDPRFLRRVEECRLVQRVCLTGRNAHLDEHSGQLVGLPRP